MKNWIVKMKYADAPALEIIRSALETASRVIANARPVVNQSYILIFAKLEKIYLKKLSL